MFKNFFFTFQVDISHFLTPGFHPAFIEVLKYLEKQDSSVRQTRAFKRFVRDYGTHYVSSSLLGAKISATVFYSNYERLKYGKQRLFNCTREATMRAFDIPVDDDDDIVDPDDDENDVDATAKMKTCPEIDLMDEERILKSTYGTAPKDGDLDKWTDKDDFLPMPVKFELTPIVNLFTVENLDDRLNISSKKILKWFLPLYLKYCTVFDLECGVETGCGFDDNCAFDENCVSDRLAKGGHRCNCKEKKDTLNYDVIRMISHFSPILGSRAKLAPDAPEGHQQKGDRARVAQHLLVL